MFKQAATPAFWVEVRVEYTKEDGSKGTVSYAVKAKRQSRTEFEKQLRELEGVEQADLRFLQDNLTEWRRVTDDDGSEVPFSPEALQQLYDIGFAGPTVAAIIRAAPKAKEKN